MAGSHQGFRLHQGDSGMDAEQDLNTPGNMIPQMFQILELINRGNLLGDLYLDFHGVPVVNSIENDLVVRRSSFNFKEYLFNLGGKNFVPFKKDQIIRPSSNLMHPGQGSAAGAVLLMEKGDVSRSVSY